jgi:hypothetical protein
MSTSTAPGCNFFKRQSTITVKIIKDSSKGTFLNFYFL